MNTDIQLAKQIIASGAQWEWVSLLMASGYETTYKEHEVVVFEEYLTAYSTDITPARGGRIGEVGILDKEAIEMLFTEAKRQEKVRRAREKELEEQETKEGEEFKKSLLE